MIRSGTTLRGIGRRTEGVQRAAHRRRLLRLLPRSSTGVEIGVWEGDFAALALRIVRPARLHLIDPWRFVSEPAYERAWYGGAIAESQEDMDRVYTGVLARFAGEIERGIVRVHRGPSAEAAALFAEDSLDWVYVDGNHGYEFVSRDLEEYFARLRGGGVICGDDYMPPYGWWGDSVTRAVDEFSRSLGLPVRLIGRQWVIERPVRALG